MEESQPSERKSHSSLMARVQKLRTRMYIEAVLCVPATSEDLFLPICLRHEQGLEPLFTGQKHVVHYEASQKIWDDWTDWTDWYKYTGLTHYDVSRKPWNDKEDWKDWDDDWDDWHKF